MPTPPPCRREARARAHARRLAKKARHNYQHRYTREQQQLRTERDIRRRYCSCGTTARHHYAHWLNELISERLVSNPPPSYTPRQPNPYPLGKQLGRLFIRDAQRSHRNAQRANPTTYPPALAMPTLSTNPDRPARLVPSYGGLVLQLEKPMRHGDAKRFLTNPAASGVSAPAELFGQLLCFNGRYFVAGPACQFSEFELTTAAIGGSVAHLNTEAGQPAARLFLCHTQAEALAMLWQLVVAYYQIPEAEARAQVEQEQRRQAWADSPEGKAKLAQVQQWLAENHPELGLEQAQLANGNDPAINRTDDWIPEYPASANEAQPEH